MKRLLQIFFMVIAVILLGVTPFTCAAQSTRNERRLITEGNKLYVARKFKDAAKTYEGALKENGSSTVARYNLGLAQIRQVTNPKDTTPAAKTLLENARKNLSDVAAMAKTKPGLASKANYNLGNLEFNQEKYKEAIDYYKQALRIDPQDNNARKNLRIAQLKQQNQDQNNDQNQNKDQDQDKDKDQNKDQNQDQNKDQNQNQDQNKDRNQDQKREPKEQEINPQTASQILQAMDNKENQTRARVNRANKGEKSQAGGRRVKRW